MAVIALNPIKSDKHTPLGIYLNDKGSKNILFQYLCIIIKINVIIDVSCGINLLEMCDKYIIGDAEIIVCQQMANLLVIQNRNSTFEIM